MLACAFKHKKYTWETSLMLTRRTFVLAASAAPVVGSVPIAWAQSTWVPAKEVEFVIPFGVGGGADLLARVVHKIIVDEKLVPCRSH